MRGKYSRWRAAALAACGILIATRAGATIGVTIGNASGHPGDTVTVGVTLRADAGEQVEGIQLDLGFNASTVVVAPTGENAPDCQVVVANKPLSGFSFLKDSAACNPQEKACDTQRALIVPGLNGFSTIPDGAMLYQCQVKIDPTAAAGTVPLTASKVIAANSSGVELCGPRETDPAPCAVSPGQITVQGACVAPPTCVGDCDNNTTVEITDIVTAVGFLLSQADPSATCLAIDENCNQMVEITEIVTAVGRLLAGGQCPAP